MKIDYASYTFVPPPRKQKLRRVGLFLSIFILIGLIVFGGWCYVKISSSQKVQIFTARLKTVFSHKKTVAENKLIPTEQPPPPVQFNFYSELPTMKLSSKTEAPIADKKNILPAATAQEKFILQLGTYHDLNSASEQRLSFLLIGLESQIVHLSIKGEKIYRLQQGPFATSAEAKVAQKKLLKKGVDASIKVE